MQRWPFLISALTTAAVIQSYVASALPAQFVSENVVFGESDGVVIVEAEHFHHQSLDDLRRWYVISAKHHPGAAPDGDPAHLEGASGGAYLEALPDTRRTHEDKLIVGENFSNEAGKLAVLHYRVHFTNPGRYYVWVRAYSTGSEDNGIHVGLNGKWPASGQRMQWCEGRHEWRWENAQRTKDHHCGVPGQIWLDIETPGVHEIQFSLREDGFEFDKLSLSIRPENPVLGIDKLTF